MMNARNRNVLLGLIAIALCGSALAHESGAYDSYPGVRWSGSATLWGGSGGYSGWSGNLSVGSAYGYPPAYVPVAVAVPIGHRHGASCHHVSQYGYENAYRKGYKHGKKHGRRHGHHYPGHH